MNCPACGHENIPGADQCEECLQPLVDVDAPFVTSQVEQRILENPVSSLGPAEPVCVEADQTLASILQLMQQRQIGCLLVMQGGQLAGIFTERDAVMKVGTDVSRLAEAPIRDLMTPDPEESLACWVTGKTARTSPPEVGGFTIPIPPRLRSVLAARKAWIRSWACGR